MKLISYLLCGALMFAFTVSSVSAGTLTVNLTAHVVTVDDTTGALGGQLAVGQTVTGSYTYETNAPDQNSALNYGEYPQNNGQGSVRISAGSLVFESDPTSQNGSFGILVHPSDWPGYYQGFFRVISQANKPLASGASVLIFDIDFSDYSGYAPTSDALLSSAPNLASYPSRNIFVGGYLNTGWYSVVFQIDSVEAVGADGGLVVSPAAGSFVRQQRFDAALLLPPGSEVRSMQASASGMQLPQSYPGLCQLASPNPQGRQAILCPDAQWILPGSGGTSRVEWRVELTNGSTLIKVVDWELIP